VRVTLEPKELTAIADAVAERLEGAQVRRTDWLTREEAAEHLRCSTRHLDRLVRLGEIAAYRPCGRPLFLAEELDAWVMTHKEG